MVGLDASLQDREGSAMERCGGVPVAAVGEQDGEVVQGRREVGVVASEQILEQREPAPIQILRFVEHAPPEQQCGQLAEVERDLVMSWAESAFEDGDRLSEKSLGLLVAAEIGRASCRERV